MRYLLALLLALTCAAPSMAATTHFPVLSGRVVDDAHLLSPQANAAITAKLEALETHNGDQLVVVTVPSLNGQSIEEYGVALGRYWGIGQKHKDNGVLLIVAPNEHQMRIEVGYGLEGTLTDAKSSAIIMNTILPQFKLGRMEQGIIMGVDAIERVLLGGEVMPSMMTPSVSTSTHTSTSSNNGNAGWIIGLFALFLFSQVVLFVIYLVGAFLGLLLRLFGFAGLSSAMQRYRSRIFPMDRMILFWLLIPSHRIGGYTGNSSGSGGFSGGGGSFGGGGGSGSW